MAEGATSLKSLRAQMAAAAQAQAEERRSLAGNSPGPTNSSTVKPQGPKPVLDGAAVRIDDRLRVAKERREEAEKQQAVRGSQILERERKAKLQVERQMEERQRKVEEQRKKEEQRRSAVEEKRKQKQEEEKEHYEAVMRRTLERSQRLEQRQKRWSWGGLSTDSDGRTGESDAGTSSPVAIVVSPASPEKTPRRQQVDKRSTSTMNLKQSHETGISKRLSSSSATLLNSPDKKYHLCPRSAASSPLHPPRGPLRSRSSDRQKSGMTTSASADGALDPSMKDKRFTSPGGKNSPSNTLGRHRSPSPAPAPMPKRTPSPAAAKQNPRNRPPSPGGAKQRPPSPQTASSKPPPIQKPALTPTGPPTLRKRDSKPKDLCPVQAIAPVPTDTSQAGATSSHSPAASAPPSKTKEKEKDDGKGGVGTNSAAEAAKMLAENRRLAREQKEREEQLRLQREEEERLRKEEEQRLAEEARLKRLEEEKILAEEKRKREEEEALRSEEEKARLAEEEALKQAELQREREEAEAKAAEEAERVRQERERIMQQNQQERMERKKRIEEIMKRTRKGDQIDLKQDDEKGMQEEEEEDNEEEDQINCEATEDLAQSGNIAMEMDTDGRDLSSGEPIGDRQEPLGSVNGNPEMDEKDNNGISTDETQAVSPVPKSRLVEGSEFLNEEDSTKAGLVPGLNGKPSPWSFEELIDLNVHSKGRPLIEAEDCNQGLIECESSPEGPMVAFEDKAAPVSSLHSSNQPIEALSEM